jgi:polysaccharide export outer membrane protein
MKHRTLPNGTGLAAALVFLVFGTGCGLIGRPKIEKPLQASTTLNPVEAAPKIRTGDILTIRLDMATSREEHQKTVDEYGNVELPFVGKIKVAGLTPGSSQEEIRKLYVPRYYTYLTVTVQSQTPRVVFVTGEVRSPGSVPYREELTVLRTIIQQGGFNEFADKRNVVLTRGDKQLRVDCVDIDRHPEKDIPVHPGDSIKVPRTVF